MVERKEAKRTILLTGSEGYIGQNVREYFKNRQGYEIVGLDTRMGMRAEEYTNFENDGIDAIVHLAAIASIPQCDRDPQEAILNNFWSSSNLFQASLIHNIPCIFTSSQAAKIPMGSMYSFTKYSSEVSANIFLDKGADIKVLRLANVYGGVGYLRKKKSVIQKFSIATIKNEAKVLNGDGTQTRDFVHVDDVCRAIHLALESKIIDIPIDIGTGIETSMLELARMFGGDFTFNPSSDTIGVDSNVADVSDAKKYLSFEAIYDLNDYIEFVRNTSIEDIIKYNL
jgi:UDP-glucose 4-epimerase